mgnify:CR=1 FL=1|jgi:hypothetical protein
MNVLKRILSVTMVVCMLLGVSGTAFAANEDQRHSLSKSETEKLHSVANEYGITINSIGNLDDDVSVVAKYDSIEEFGLALANTHEINTNPIMPSPANLAANNIVTPNATTYDGTRQITITKLPTLTFIGYIHYKCQLINGKRHATSLYKLTTSYEGLNIGYSFKLIRFYGKPISDFWYEGGKAYYKKASISPMYYYEWTGTLKWGVEIDGVLVGMSKDLSSWGWGNQI